MTTPAEQADLDKMKAEQAKAQAEAFAAFRMFLDMQPDMLRHTGHKTVEAAILYTVKDTISKCNKLAKAFVSKWPD